MMLKRMLFSGATLLALGGCELDDTAGAGCEEIRNDIQSTRGDTVITTSGLRYIELRQGTGTVARACRPSLVAYTGRLVDGTQFDQGGFEFIPGFSRYIRGFEQGVIGMRTEGRRRLIIPPELGYGATPRTNPTTGATIIPANSTLIFDIELTATQ